MFMTHTEHARYSCWPSLPYMCLTCPEAFLLELHHLSFLNLTLNWACSGMCIVNSACSGVCPPLACFTLWAVQVPLNNQGDCCLGNDSCALVCCPRWPFLHGFTSWLYFFQFCTLPEASPQSLLCISAYPERLREAILRPSSLSFWFWVLLKREGSHAYLNRYYSSSILC